MIENYQKQRGTSSGAFMARPRAVAALVILLMGIGVARGVANLSSQAAAAQRSAAAVAPLPTPLPSMMLPALPTNRARPDFESGMAYPRFGQDAYSSADRSWALGLESMVQQTGSQWVEIELNLKQPTADSTTITPGPWVITPTDLGEGIDVAHAMGLHVFVVPHLWYGNQQWGGYITFKSHAQASAWFASYWNALKPYLLAAQQAGADQFALGNEYVGIEKAPPALWTQLIDEAHDIYSGRLTYDLNWGTYTPYSWMSDPNLTYLGVSMYESLAPGPVSESEATLAAEWRDRILPLLDQLSTRSGKQIILSEVGYKNSTDALFNPWNASTNAPSDPRLQADAYQAAVQAAFSDPHVVGIYFWGWSMGTYAPNNLPAATMLHKLYLSSAA